jgi:hypothetical protein
MTEIVGKDQPPDGGKERRRQAIEDVVLAFRPEIAERFRGLLERDLPGHAEALVNLADLDVHRVVKHRLLIEAARRARGDEALEEGIRRVLEATLPGTLDAEDRRSRAERARAYLEEVAAMEGAPRLQAAHWRRWVSGTRDLFAFSLEEATFQACNDETIVPKATPGEALVPSRLIVAEFWSNRPATAFRRYIDPPNWPSCSSFWLAMAELPPRGPRPPDGYDCDFRETVAIFNEELTVPLQVGVRVRPDQSRVWTRFNIARPYFDASVPVDVDTGTVSAEEPPGGPGRTLVRASKYLHWSDPGRPDLTELACDLGWSELMIEMADACREAPPERTVAETAPGTSVDDAVRRFVEQVTAECQAGIGDARPHLQDLIGRFTGRSWDARWINDLLAMGQLTARRYGRIASHVRGLADALDSAEDQRGRS